MTAPLPSPRLSPTAGMANALTRLAIRRLTARVAELRQLLGSETELNHQLRTAAGYRETKAAGYIDRSDI
ncbi:hypothetical protein AB5J55_35090 [Streptomyces sp. R11]|uniref:Uncharacterized protein n=1 Tax=Streptomyces sp. R11 TaxID=3238625 RepID=A0AB39N9D8_9ACTN